MSALNAAQDYLKISVWEIVKVNHKEENVKDI